MAKYINTQTVEYPVTEQEIRALHPNISFPVIFVPPEHFKVVFPAPIPPHDPQKELMREISPLLTSKGHYEQQYEIYSLK